MKRKMLTAAISAFACSVALGTALCFVPKTASAANDQTIFSENFASSTMDSSVWTTTGDVSTIVETGGAASTLSVWTGSNATISGETATINANGRIYTKSTYSDYELTFTVGERTGAFYLLFANSQTAAITANNFIQFNTDRALPCEAGGAVSGDSTVVSQWVNGSTWTLSVANGVATLKAGSSTVCQSWDIGTTAAHYPVIVSNAALNVSGVSLVDNTAISGYQLTLGTTGGGVTSKAVAPGYDTRLGWAGATELVFETDLSGLGDATFKVALGDVSATISPDGGRYVLTLWDGDESVALSSGNTDASVVITGMDDFYVTIRNNGALSVSYNGVSYASDTALTASPYGSIEFSLTAGAEKAVVIDNVTLKVDEYEEATGTVAGIANWSTSDGVTVSGETATISNGFVYLPVSSDYTMTFTATRGTPGVTVLDAAQSFLIGINVADPATYTAGAWFTASGSSQNSNLWIDKTNVTTDYTTNSWIGQDGTMTLTVKDGVATLKHAVHGTAYSNFPVGTSGYVSFYVPMGAGAATVKDVTYTDNTYVPDTSIHHTFQDESGLLYYVSTADEANATVSLASVAPTTTPNKDGYTFTGWTKDGSAVGDTVSNTADATYKPVYAIGAVNFASATLNGDIGLNFYMNLPAAVTADNTAKVVFTVNGETQEIAVASGTATSNGTRFTAHVAAQDYDKDVTLSLVTTAGDGVTYSYSVKDYVDAVNLADGEAFEDFKPLANAMQAYGAAAQDYFTEKTVTDNHPEITKETLSSHKPVLVSGTLPEGVYDLGSTVMMESKTSLRYYFTTDATTAASLVCKIDGVTATVKSKVGGSTTYYYVEVEDIAAQDLDRTYDISIGDYTVRISPLGYAYAIVRNASSYDTSLVNAVKALYLYNMAADAYFNPAAEAPATVASAWDDDSDWNNTFDFVLNVEADREVKILQLTDIQIIDSTQERYEERLPTGHVGNTSWHPTNLYENAFKYMREAVAKSSPDLIVLSGDNTYGEFDDNGSMVKALIKEMDSYEIPWTLTWGNHDNETYLGTVWLNSQYAASKYCRFTIEDSGITGSSNFTIGVVQGGNLTTTVFCLDTNGHTGITSSHPASESTYICTNKTGAQQDQIDWVESKLAAIKTANGGNVVQSIGFLHHSLYGLKKGLETKYGYTGTTPFVLESETQTASVTAKDGDFGAMNYEPAWTDIVGKGGDTELALHNVSKAGNIVGWFMGHEHVNSASVLYDGVRYTYGLKASLFDAYQSGDVGGTLITIGQNSSMTARHLYTDLGTTRPDA